MKRILFIDEYKSSLRNGIGTFRDYLLPSLIGKTSLVNLISLDADVSKFVQEENDYGHHYLVPPIGNRNWRDYANIIVPLLQLYIEDSADNVFLINHSPCSDFIQVLRRLYPKSSLVFIIHDQGWCSSLLGDETLLHSIIIGGAKPAKISAATVKGIRDYCSQETMIYNLVDAVVCLSPSTYRILTDIYKINTTKLWLIPNGYNPTSRTAYTQSEARLRINIDKNIPLLIYAGRAAQYKGIEALLFAINLLRNKFHDNIKCAICGSLDGFSKYNSLISQIASSLIFPGFLSTSNLMIWYKSANIGVVPSYSEQFGYSAIEMAMSGLTIVTSNGNGLRDIFKNTNAYIANIGSDVFDYRYYGEELASTIHKALYSPSEDIRKRKNSLKQMIIDNFSVDNMINAYCQLFETL